MKVKVKASVAVNIDSYNYTEKIGIEYTYKVKGFRKDSGFILLVFKNTGEPKSEYDKRIIKELSQLTREDVVERVKKAIISNLMFRVASSTAEEEKKRLLKELNNIKFNFTVKDKL